MIAVAGYLAMYRGLESGHVGLVSAISACYGGVIAVLSVVLLREHLTAAAVAGIAATVAGVMLAVTQREPAPEQRQGAGARHRRGVRPGRGPVLRRRRVHDRPVHAQPRLAGPGGGRARRCHGDPARAAGYPAARAGRSRLAPGLGWALAAGLTDAAGLVFFTRGDQVGLVAVTAAVSSAYPVIPLIGGLLIFRERLMRQQVGSGADPGRLLLGFRPDPPARVMRTLATQVWTSASWGMGWSGTLELSRDRCRNQAGSASANADQSER